jgi:hypothetical protein
MMMTATGLARAMALTLCLTAGAARAQAPGMLGEDRMLELIFGVPEVSAWADAVRANGNRVVLDTEQTADPACPDLACLTCYRLLEDLPTHRVTFGIFCANPFTGDLLRWDDPQGAPRQLTSDAAMPLEDNVVAPADDLLSRMPTRLAGWFRWDGGAKSTAMTIVWTSRGLNDDGMVRFLGQATYVEPSGRTTRAPVRMLVDDIGGAVVMWEEGGAGQADFETGGQFTGAIMPDTLVIEGRWTHPTMDRAASFRLMPDG